jgi:hypothetical protein
MSNLKNDPALAELPPPVTLTLEELSAVASDSGEALGNGGGKIIIAGGIPVGGPYAVA